MSSVYESEAVEVVPTEEAVDILDFAESYIIMHSDGSLKFLQDGDLVNDNIVLPAGPADVESDRIEGTCSVDASETKTLNSSNLKSQERKQCGGPHECDFCNKRFSTGYALKAHKRTHTGEKPYICPETTCQKRFKTSGDLQKHIRTHTGERPFKCGICFKAFTTHNIRKVHMRVHTGERPYECTYEGCERRFSSATNYRNHVRTHTGEKPYVCSIESCQKRFAEYSSLYKHYTVHSQKKRYECPLCERQYRQLSTLNIHISTIHKNEMVSAVEKSEGKIENCRVNNSMFTPVKPLIRYVNSNVISQHVVLHPKNGTLVNNPKTITYKGENGETLSLQEFMDLQLKYTKSQEEVEDNALPSSVVESDISCDVEEAMTLPPIKYEPLKAITCGSEAILVLSVPSASRDTTETVNSVPELT